MSCISYSGCQLREGRQNIGSGGVRNVVGTVINIVIIVIVVVIDITGERWWWCS